MHYIAVVNGPNLNLLGRRCPEIYGTRTAADIVADLVTGRDDVEVRMWCYNGEGQIIDLLHQVGYDPECVGIVLNAGAYTHTSLAIADAIEAIAVPVVEVHMSNVFAREAIRHRSMIARVCIGSVSGFGEMSYQLAVLALMNRYEQQR